MHLFKDAFQLNARDSRVTGYFYLGASQALICPCLVLLRVRSLFVGNCHGEE